MTTFVILGTEKSLKNILCPFCAQIVPWLIFEQVDFDPHSNLKEMKLNLFLLTFITHFKKPSCPKKILLRCPCQNCKHEQVAIHDIDQPIILYGRACRSLIQY